MRSENTIPVTLATGVTQYKGLTRLREFLKLQTRSWVHYTATARWISFLNCTAFYSDLAKINPNLIRKIYRAYLSTRMTCTQRVSILIGHYSFIHAHGWGPMVLQSARVPVLLAAFAGKSGVRYRLVLTTGLLMEREGDLILQLFREDDLVCSCAFSFLQLDRMCIAVGGIQGPPHDGLATIRETTRDLHGLRPKQLMIRLLSAIGYLLACDKLRLVSNAHHTAVRSRREGRVHADYDRLWIECGASRGADGDFEIQCTVLHSPQLADLPSKRRSAARNRHECLRMIIDSVTRKLPRSGANETCHRTNRHYGS